MHGDFPWQLDPADAWKMICDGFNESEIAYVGGLTRFQARDLIARSMRLFSKNVPTPTFERRVVSAKVISW